jgi:hypothetical protein
MPVFGLTNEILFPDPELTEENGVQITPDLITSKPGGR